MITRKISLVSLFCTLLLVGIQAASLASLQYARTNGTLTEDNITSLTVAVGVYQNVVVGSAPQLSGNVTMAGRTGKLNFTMNALPGSVVFSSQAANGVTYQNAVITTKTFSYLDLNSQQRTPAWMQLTLTKGSDGTQRMGFQIFAATGNTLIAETENSSAPGVYAQLPLNTGNILLRL